MAASCLFLMLFGATEVAWQATTRAALDYAVRHVSRVGSTGVGSAPGAPAGAKCRNPEMIKYLASKATGNFLRMDRLEISMASFSNYGSLQAGGAGTSGAGGAGDTVRYTLTYRQPWLFPAIIRDTIFKGSQHLQHTATALAKNEPFTPAAGC